MLISNFDCRSEVAISERKKKQIIFKNKNAQNTHANESDARQPMFKNRDNGAMLPCRSTANLSAMREDD